jgi:hypothetical protein
VGWQQFAWPVSLLTLILAIPGIVGIRRRRLALVLIAGPAVVDTLVVLATYGNDRFVLSAIPSLCIGAAATLVWLGNWLTRNLHGPARIIEGEDVKVGFADTDQVPGGARLRNDRAADA